MLLTAQVFSAKTNIYNELKIWPQNTRHRNPDNFTKRSDCLYILVMILFVYQLHCSHPVQRNGNPMVLCAVPPTVLRQGGD